MNITKNQNTVKPKMSSSCRFCRHYKFESRRDGHCEMLQVLVNNTWESCFLFGFPFSTQGWHDLDIANKSE